MNETKSYSPGLEGVIAAETSLSFLDTEQEEIVIRGYDLLALIRQKGYSDVVGLLLDGELPAPQRRAEIETEMTKAEVPPRVYEILKLLPSQMHAMDRLRTAVSALAGFDPEANSADPASEKNRAPRVIGQIAQIVANLHHIAQGSSPERFSPEYSLAENFLRVLVRRPVSAAEVRAFEQSLIAYSEHELPNSTFAARVVASTLSDMYGALTAAVASLKGPLHGGANEAVMYMLLEAKNSQGLEALIRQKLAKKERIMGFGHRVYMRRMDPRAQLLKEVLQNLVQAAGRGQEYVEMCQVGEDIMRTEKGLYPNLDYYAAPVYYLLGIPIELYTPIFFAARTVGLLAHIIEQHSENRLYRPRVLYKGPRGKKI
ncbi:MAG: citrate synthase [Bacteroidia bacterium]|nr:citrate synthase [Bacteroidia bacterium]MCX7764277.1 citrate synthase [Bacteroidia bacterium]MDW8058125.1 citrate synthase [Bacteroidia bacterium]